MGVSSQPKVRVHRLATGSVRREHPEGGVFYLRRLDVTKCLRMQEQLEQVEFVRDPKTGEILYNQKTGDPVVRRSQDFASVVDFVAEEVIDRFTHVNAEIEKEVDGDIVIETVPLESTPENIRALLNVIPERAEDSLLAWALNEAIGIAEKTAALEKKT